jgi:ectoine hydroxylase-related dioxygenase (phytanoyl-CoA dioxygenase family)
MKEANNFTSSVWSYGPVAGDLIIFPAYLSHFVESNMSAEDRISIAFNTALRLNND